MAGFRSRCDAGPIEGQVAVCSCGSRGDLVWAWLSGMNPLDGPRVSSQARNRPHRTLNQITAAVGTDVVHRARALRAKRALIGTDAGVSCRWRQIRITTLTVWLQQQQGSLGGLWKASRIMAGRIPRDKPIPFPE